MNFRELVAGDPFSTALDRAVAESFATVEAAESAASRLLWSQYSQAERDEMTEYWDAVRANRIWDAEMERAWDRQMRWSSREQGWGRETDEEFAARTARLKWMPVSGRWEFIGEVSAEVASPIRKSEKRATSPLAAKFDGDILATRRDG